ncbi:MAG: phosphatidylserine decarboxylase [Pseudomonadales bacterium]|nr:phosphatidylserine decarboxylase [Pseudomonadales bacterium]NIX07109.1 phosphatidylserine decarboxylase [Pseudomonadales bacterium]
MSAWFAALQRLLPQHELSRLIGSLAKSEVTWIRKPFIHGFARAYGVSLDEAECQQLNDFLCFNDFFTRALRQDARPLAQDPAAVLCPADGTVSQTGLIEDGQLLQAKGHRYSLHSLTGETDRAFEGGTFATVYLAPSDYHRVHLPADGTLLATTSIPGALFSVNAQTETTVEGLFARNERLVCRFRTDHGQMLVVLVGALIVASIETVWAGPESPYEAVTSTAYNEVLLRGAEIGRFLLGSTVIVCFEPGRMELLPHVQAGARVRMGEAIGTFCD